MLKKKKKISRKRSVIHNMFVIIEKEYVWKWLAIILFFIILFVFLFDIRISPKPSFISKLFNKKEEKISTQTPVSQVDNLTLAKEVLPENGVVLPIVWGDLGKRMVKDGVIDEAKFRALFEGKLSTIEEQMLSGTVKEPIVLNQQNSRYILDLLWAFGLSNKNEILEKGEMADPRYGGVGNFASTGGWSLAKGAAVDYYSKYPYVVLSKEQQDLVDKVSRGIYRPCCGNSTHFPDCNHGMAMLGLLELLAKNNASEDEMYSIALKVNSFWFPQTYLDLATYFKEQGKNWDKIDAKIVLSAKYSSAQGYQRTRQQIQSLPKPQQGGGGCGA